MTKRVMDKFRGGVKMGKYILLIALVLILLLVYPRVTGKAFNQLTSEQKQFYWKCLDTDGCSTLLKNKQYAAYRSCSIKCNEKAVDYAIPQSWCKDSDGEDYLNKGIVTTNLNPLGKEDYCKTFSSGKEYLIEGGCKNNAYVYYQKSCKEIGEKYTCSDGACFLPNQAPILNPIGDKQVNEGEELSFEVIATDVEGNALEYSVENLPTGAAFEGNTFSWTPSYEQAGNYKIKVIVSDGELSDEETITITIIDVSLNNAPILNLVDNKEVKEGGTLSFTLSASDQDEDDLTYSTTDLPTGAIFDQDIKTFFWNPDYEQAGLYEVTFIVSDGKSEDSEIITIGVTNEEVPACIVPIDGMIITENTILCNGEYYLPKGISIKNNGITLNGNGAKLYANYQTGVNWEDSEAISMNGFSSVTLKNLNIEKYYRAITIKNSKNILIYQNQLQIKSGNTGLTYINVTQSLVMNNLLSASNYIKYSSYNSFDYNNHISNGNNDGNIIIVKLDADNSKTSFNNVIKNSNFKGWTVNVDLQPSTHNNIVENNEFEGVSVPVFVIGSNGNTIRNNLIKDSTMGIKVANTDEFNSDNIIYENTIIGTKNSCIDLTYTSDNPIKESKNTIFNNNFIACKLPPKDTFSSMWNEDIKNGNYWDIFDEPAEGCEDLDNNKICDNPFVIDEDSKDNFPFTQQNGWK